MFINLSKEAHGHRSATAMNWGAEMAHGVYKLSVAAIKASGAAKLQDGGSPILDKGASAGKWLFRFSLAGKRREMGPGPWPRISLAEARRLRDKWAAMVASGIDPIEERNPVVKAERAELNRRDPAISEMAHEAYEAKKAELRDDGKSGHWMTPPYNPRPAIARKPEDCFAGR